DARFILVGSGPLRAAAEDFAARLDLAPRALFVGRTPHVGFWIEKMDALALTSRHEGLPNVLIEAQMLGVPAVTTPAGGAADAVAPLDCNFILPEAADVDAALAADHLASLANRDGDSALADASRLRAWARARFAVDTMAERTIDLFG
ncbi:MAG: glycosyltransferase, partial [Sphingomonadaceae bacterium]|nr:glycosyltransferase [Sphingomonadaceae bacterium]